MKIALVSLARRGGMVHFLAELAEGLAPLARIAVVISARADLDYLPREIERIDVDTGSSRLGSAMRLLSPLTWLHLASRLRELRADVVHIAGVHEWNPLVAALCRLEGVPVIYTVHDPELHPGTPWRMRIGDALTARLASTLVALTKHGRTQLLERGEQTRRIAVVPHPMYTIFRKWRPRSQRPERVILYFGRLEAYKGLEVLVQAFRSIRPELPGWRLIVAGDGRLPDELLQTSADTEVINRYVSDEEVARLINRCSIMALPYTSATQSGVIALAQAFQRPVVATAVGGLREMVIPGRTGILVRPGDAGAFGKALSRLAGNGALRAKMKREIRKIADSKWGPQVVARKYLEVYSSALHRRGKL